MSAANKCPVCHSTNITVFVEISKVPILCNQICKSRIEAIQAPRADIRLGFCGVCGHIFNLAFEPNRMKYDQDYENSLHFSPYFQEYAKSLATRLLNRYNLYGKDIIEIGCGKGDFLLLLCEQGQNRGIGFDPSYVPKQPIHETDERVAFIKDFYSKKYSSYQADFICCQHVLEHIQYPCEFLTELRESIGNRFDTMIYFEVPNVIFTLRYFGIWDLIYEHCSYFSAGSLAYLLTSCGFKVYTCEKAFDGQFLFVEASPVAGLPNSNCNPWLDLERMANDVENFADRYQKKIMCWRSRFAEIERRKQRAVGWGAGSKGVTFLNTLKIQEQIEYVVDLNPNKHGNYVSGTGQKIVSPEFLLDYQPDIVIVMNPIYCDEIKMIIKKMNISTRVLSI